jgi:hypothetical protein
MIDPHKLNLFQELFSQAKTILVIYSADALRDHLISATALYKNIQSQTDKEVSLLSSEDLSKIESDIVYLDETKTEVGNKNLCVAFDYVEESIENVSYHISQEEKKFYLTIKPKKGAKPLSQEGVEFSYTGAEADMIILVGVDSLESLEQLYYGYENLYQNTHLVSINSYETNFGTLKLDADNSSSLSEFTSELLYSLNFQVEPETATNLLAGIDEETSNLTSYLVTADTFEIVAKLLRSGARRFARKKFSQAEQPNQVDQAGQIGRLRQSFGQVNQPGQVVQAYQVEDQPILTELKQKTKVSKTDIKSSNTQKPKLTIQKNKKSVLKPGDLNYEPSNLGPGAGG